MLNQYFANGKIERALITSRDFEQGAAIVRYYQSVFTVFLQFSAKKLDSRLSQAQRQLISSLNIAGAQITVREMLKGGPAVPKQRCLELFTELSERGFGETQTQGKTFVFVKKRPDDVSDEQLEQIGMNRAMYSTSYAA